jgi:hypothetical protein
MGSQPRLSTQRRNFQWLQGQSKTIAFTAREPPPDPATGHEQPALNLSGMLIEMRVRKGTITGKDNDLAEQVAFLTSDIISQIEIEDQNVEETEGKFKIYWKTAISKFLRPGNYNYIVVMIDPVGEETPLLVGEIYLEARS